MTAYQMPTAALGDLVLFYPHEGAAASVALVIGVSSRTLTLWAFAPGVGGVEKTSVHHSSDPGMAEYPAWKEYGCWDFKTDRFAILSEKLSVLERRVAELGGQKGQQRH